MGFPVLSVILFSPLLGALICSQLPETDELKIKKVSAYSMGLSFVLAMYVFFSYDTSVGGVQFVEKIPWITDLGVAYHVGVDGISLPMLLLATIISFSAIFTSWNTAKRVKEYFVLLLIFADGVIGTFIAQDVFIYLLFYEVVVIPIYILIINWGSNIRYSKEYAGMKLTMYLLMGSAFMLAGVVAVYLNAFPAGERTFDMVALSSSAALSRLAPEFQIIIFFMFMLAFCTLVSMFPFHSWSPDGHAGAPTAVSMIHAGLLKKIGAYSLIRLGLLILPYGAKFWAPLIALFGMINVVYAAYIALIQKDLKYIIGFSSVSHMGYVLFGISALNIVSVSGALANMVAHGIMVALFFSQVGYIYEKTHFRSIPYVRGLAHQMPRATLGFMLAGFASVGLPGLIGFVPEYTIFVGTFAVYPVFAVFAISGVIFSALYVLKTLSKIIFGPKSSRFDKFPDEQGVDTFPLLILGTFLVLFGLFPELFMRIIRCGIMPLAPLFDSMVGAPTIAQYIPLLGGVL